MIKLQCLDFKSSSLEPLSTEVQDLNLFTLITDAWKSGQGTGKAHAAACKGKVEASFLQTEAGAGK